MKNFSLFSLLGLLAFVAMPIYAQDVYFDENYIIVPEDTTVQNVDEEDVAVADEIIEDVEAIADEVEDVAEEIEDVVLAVEEEPTLEDAADWELIPELDLSDFGGITSVSLGSSNYTGPLARIIAWWLWLFWVALVYLMFVYFTLLPISAWEIYRKAGKKGWAFLVPFWGTMVYSEIAWMSKRLWLLPWLWVICAYLVKVIPADIYWIVMLVCGIITLLWLIVCNYRIARRYGWNIFASILHAILIFCPITVLVLGIGNYKYQAKSEETVVEA